MHPTVKTDHQDTQAAEQYERRCGGASTVLGRGPVQELGQNEVQLLTWIGAKQGEEHCPPLAFVVYCFSTGNWISVT